MASRTKIVSAIVAGLLVAGCTTAVAASTSTPVECTITDNTLSCPLPEPPAPVTVTATETATETATPDPVTVTQDPVTVTAGPVTQTVTAPPVTQTVTAQPTTTAPSSTAASTTTDPAPARWVPTPGAQWQWQLSSVPTQAELNAAYAAGARAFDIDGDAATPAVVAAIHALGPNVGAVCYIDVGGWEDYRSDAAAFPDSVKGKTIGGWPSEKWLDVRQTDILEPLMKNRIQTCKTKGFDAVEPDLLDGWQNDTGFPITAAQQIAYNKMIAQLAHDAGLSVAQKGDTDQAADLQPYFDWTLNEQCAEYNECAPLAAYKNAGKAVWIVEYKTTAFQTTACNRGYQFAGQAMMLKSVNLTASPRTPCMAR